MDLHQYLMLDKKVSKETMADLLQNYTYQEFHKDNSQFLKKGKQVWYLQGSI